MNRYTQDEILAANATCRGRGAIGLKAIVPRIIFEDYAVPGVSILDFGAGVSAQHTRMLLDEQFDVTAYEFGRNVCDLHDPHALQRTYDVVYASNVLNVQSSEDMLERTLEDIDKALRFGSVFVCNFPASPRKCEGVRKEGIEMLLQGMFTKVTEHKRSKRSAPVWVCVK